LSRRRRGPVQHRGRRHLHQSPQRDPAPDVHRADAARGELQFHRVLADARRHARPGVRVLHPDGGRGRSRDRPRDPRRAVPQREEHQRRRPREAEGMSAESIYLTIVLAPLAAAIVAGLFGKQIGRAGAHTITIAGVAISFVLSLLVLNMHVLEGVPPYNGTVYEWATIGSVRIEVGFLVDNLTAVMMAVVTFVSLAVH